MFQKEGVFKFNSNPRKRKGPELLRAFTGWVSDSLNFLLAQSRFQPA